jgi:hypothetical protein
MAHPHLQCRRPRPRHRHSGLGWRILTCTVGGPGPDTATPALDGASSRALSEAPAPTPPLRPWMVHPHLQCRRPRPRHRHSGLGWRILTCSGGAAPAHTATPALDGASSPAVAALRPPTPPLRPWMAHPPAHCRRPWPRHRHSGPGWRILPRSVGAAPAHTATPALDGASSPALSALLPPTPPLRPWMAHPHLQWRRCARALRASPPTRPRRGRSAAPRSCESVADRRGSGRDPGGSTPARPGR